MKIFHFVFEEKFEISKSSTVHIYIMIIVPPPKKNQDLNWEQWRGRKGFMWKMKDWPLLVGY